MKQRSETLQDEVRRANRVARQIYLMRACVLETAARSGHVVTPQHALAELELELRDRQTTARELRKQLRMVKRANARLDLPEQIW